MHNKNNIEKHQHKQQNNLFRFAVRQISKPRTTVVYRIASELTTLDTTAFSFFFSLLFFPSNCLFWMVMTLMGGYV